MTSISLKELRKRKVVDTSTAETIGRVRDIRVNPSAARVHGVDIKGSRAGFLLFEDIEAIGVDAVTLTGADLVRDETGGLPQALSDAIGARLLDTRGHHLGKVTDMSIDDSGAVVAVHTAEGSHSGRLLGIGPYAVVIEAT